MAKHAIRYSVSYKGGDVIEYSRVYTPTDEIEDGFENIVSNLILDCCDKYNVGAGNSLSTIIKQLGEAEYSNESTMSQIIAIYEMCECIIRGEEVQDHCPIFEYGEESESERVIQFIEYAKKFTYAKNNADTNP